jgi:hypothetical protein
MIKIGLLLFICSINMFAFSETRRLETSDDQKWLNANYYVVQLVNKYAKYSIDDYLNQFGKPKSIKIIEVDNRYSDSKDEIYSIEYDIFTVKIRRLQELREWLLLELIIKRKGFYSQWEIDIGTEREKVKDTFGIEYLEYQNIMFDFFEDKISIITIYNLE